MPTEVSDWFKSFMTMKEHWKCFAFALQLTITRTIKIVGFLIDLHLTKLYNMQYKTLT